jgi:hypothetical protein
VEPPAYSGTHRAQSGTVAPCEYAGSAAKVVVAGRLGISPTVRFSRAADVYASISTGFSG